MYINKYLLNVLPVCVLTIFILFVIIFHLEIPQTPNQYVLSHSFLHIFTIIDLFIGYIWKLK